MLYAVATGGSQGALTSSNKAPRGLMSQPSILPGSLSSSHTAFWSLAHILLLRTKLATYTDYPQWTESLRAVLLHTCPFLLGTPFVCHLALSIIT